MVTEASLSPVAQAIAYLGGASAVAKARGLKTAWGASKWARDGLPAEHVLWLAEQTGWKFTPHQLAPGLYPHTDDGLPPDRRLPIEDAPHEARPPDAVDILIRNGARLVYRP